MAFICTLKLLILQPIFKIQVLLKTRDEKQEDKDVENMLRPERNA